MIATLGGEQLIDTISTLNKGSIVPDEVLICIPQDDSYRVQKLSFTNIRVIKTSCRGQVAQRAIGFQKSNGQFVLQLDDDMLVDKYCVEKLINLAISRNEKIAVAPSLVCESNKQSFYRKPRNKFSLKLYYWLLNGINGYQAGRITRAGTNVGIDPEFVNKNDVEVEWVPGGCLLHRRENLIFENFYPFKGKAYSEDLYHSYFLRKNHIKLIVCTSAKCFLDDSINVYIFPISDFFTYVVDDFKARKYFVKLSKKSIIRMYLFYFVVVLRYIYSRVKKIVKSKKF